MKLPQHITIMEIGFVFDGGSLDITVEDENRQKWGLFLQYMSSEESPLGWSLLVNEKQIEKMSPEEDQWILLMKEADIAPSSESEPPGEKVDLKNAVILANNIQAAFDAMEEGHEAWLEHHRQEFLKNIRL